MNSITKQIVGYRSVKSLFTAMISGGLLLVSGHCSAEIFTIRVKATVVEKTCDIYGDGGKGQPISVDFGDMIIKQIDGNKYETKIPYTLECEEDDPKLKLQFSGPRAPFDSTLLYTQSDNLGIKFRVNNTKTLALNEWHNFSLKSSPTLTAIPVPSNIGGIRGGEFTTTGILSVEYQ